MAETLLLLSGRAKATEPVLTDLQVAELSLNLDGRLRVAGKPAIFTPVAGALTTAGVAAANLVAVDVSDASNVTFGLKNTGSVAMAAGVFIFEASLNSTDGVDGDWVTIQAVRSDSNVVETGRATLSLAAGVVQAYTWEASVNGYKWFRVRCTTSVTASSIATWTIGRGSYASEPIPAMQTHPVTGSGTFTVAGTVTSTPALAGTAVAVVTTASTNATVQKASPGNLYEVSVTNPTATAAFLKFYNKASAPTVGTDIPLFTIPIPANSTGIYEFGELGKRFSVGIAVAVTALIGAADTGVAVAGIQISGTYL